MIRRLFLSTGIIIIAVVLVSVALLFRSNSIDPDAIGIAAAKTLAPPSITRINPNSAPNNLDTLLTINGTNFTAELSGTVVIAPPRVYLDDVVLQKINWISSTELTAVVPWGLEAGVYTLTVVNSDGGIGSLANAFIVTQAINVWTTGGPYGGDIMDIAVSPVISSTTFVAVRNAGLFRTQDNGEQWSQLIHNLGVSQVTYGPSPTNTLYYMGEQVGLNRSADGGETWETLSGGGFAFALDVESENNLWIGDYDGVQISTDGGMNWERRSNGLPINTDPVNPEFYVMRLAVHPLNGAVGYVGYNDGRLYRTTNEGLDWILLDNGLPPSTWGYAAQGLTIDPFSPNVILYSRWMDNDAFGYRSTDGGDTWTPILAPQGCAHLSDPVFSQCDPGVVYIPAGGNLFAVSNDHGENWACYGVRPGDFMISIGLDPDSNLPGYLGGNSAGVWRSLDGGQNWENASDGITGLPIMDITASPSYPGTVYVAGEAAGAFKSDNAGDSWQKLTLVVDQEPGAFSVGVDPIHPTNGYVGSGWGVYRNPGNQGWLFSTMPVTYQAFLDVLSVSEISPSIIYVGGRSETAALPYNGVAFRSADFGASWTPLDFGQPVGYVTYITIDPTNSQRVYIITGQSWPPNNPTAPNVFRSEDSGSTWQSIYQNLGGVRTASMAIPPDDSSTIYIGAYWPTVEHWTVFKSLDYGDTWEPTDIPLTWSIVNDLVVDPLAPDTVFAGTGEGLFITTDGGISWSRFSGKLAYANVLDLAISAAEGRSILYVSAQGGWISTPLIQNQRAHSAADILQGGVYQLTLDHRSTAETIFLPLVIR